MSPFSAYHGTMEFNRFDVVKIADFFSKIDMTKICRLKMMIRKITHLRTSDRKAGRPQELAFYMQSNQLAPEPDVPIQTPPDPDPKMTLPADPEIKICEEDEQLRRDISSQNRQPSQPTAPALQNGRGKPERGVAAINKELQILGICKDRNPD